MVKKATEAKPNHLLRAARKERNWTQKDVAERIGAPQSFNVSRWEQGTAFPSAHYVQQLCLLFGKSAKELGLLLEKPIEKSEPSPDEDSSPLWTVPYRRSLFFTGREDVLIELHSKLAANSTAALTQSQALSGLGGIGKTQIAIEYAYRSREFYHDILWMRAASRETLLSDFVELARLLNLPGRDAPEQQLIVEAVKRWLIDHQGWLLILDNADDLVLAAEFLPADGQGHILLTTRAQATGTLASIIAVEKLGPEESMLLLLRRAKLLAPSASLDAVEVATLAAAQAIAIAMDGLPLALDQAGAYIEETGCSLSEYLALFQRHRRELLSRRSSVAPEYPYSVASTWALAFKRVEQENPAAPNLLRLCAFLHPDAIPESLLFEGAEVLDAPLQMLAKNAYQRNEALETLRKYSLVRRHPQAHVLSIHRLVQVVLRDELDEQAQRQWAERSVRVIDRAFPEVKFESWQRCQDYLPHVQTCAELIEHYQFTFPEAAHLLLRTGYYLYERGLFAQAEPLLQCALAIRELEAGPEHPATAESLRQLADLYERQGKIIEAETHLQRALAIYEQTLGPGHLNTAETITSLAILYTYEGKYEQAEPLYQQALAIFEQELGPENPITAETLGYLGHLYTYEGKYEQAEPLYQRVLTIFEKALGLEHPHTATSLASLAFLYHRQDKYEQAEPLLQQALSIKEQIQGPEHLDTAVTLDNLARLYTDQGRYEQAEPLHLRALAVFEHVLGPEHFDTAIALDNLGHLYDLQGRYEQAASLMQQALAILENAVGSEHPRLVTVFLHLAQLYEHQASYIQANPFYQRALTIQEQTLGPDHPDTIAVRASYTQLLDELKRSTEAAKTENLE